MPEQLDLKTYKFQDANILCLITDPKLLAEAELRGFLGHAATPYNKLFSDLFFSGGRLNFKSDLDPTFKSVAVPYLKSFMQSFEPKHEHKEAICAMLLSELVDL